MAFKVEFSHLAIRDLELIVDFYIEKSLATAKKYYSEIIMATEKLSEFPEIGRIVPELADEEIFKYRELIYEHYRIIYRREKEKIIIVRIIDSRSLFKFES